MATTKPHVYKVSRSHAVASKMKPGEEMTARMKMLPPDEGAAEDADYAMEEQDAGPYKAPAATPSPKPKGKARTPAEALRMKREKPMT